MKTSRSATGTENRLEEGEEIIFERRQSTPSADARASGSSQDDTIDFRITPAKRSPTPHSQTASILSQIKVSSFRSFGLNLLSNSEIENLDKWIATARHAGRPVKLVNSMSMSTFRSAGLHKITSDQLERLDNWLNTHWDYE